MAVRAPFGAGDGGGGAGGNGGGGDWEGGGHAGVGGHWGGGDGDGDGGGGGGYMWEECCRYVKLVQECGRAKDLTQAKRLHGSILQSGLARHRFLSNHVIHMYGRCHAPHLAHAVFSRIRSPNSFSCTILIGAYTHAGLLAPAFSALLHMLRLRMPLDRITALILLSACGTCADLPRGRALHAQILCTPHLAADPMVGNSLVSMYGRCGRVAEARRAFDCMPARNVISWNAMITVCARGRQCNEALYLFRSMQLEGTLPDEVTFTAMLDALACGPSLDEGRGLHGCAVSCGFESDVIVGTALVKMYAGCGSLDDARGAFDSMPVRDVVAWNAMISAYTQHGRCVEAVRLFQDMSREGQIPDSITFVNVLAACACMSAVPQGKLVHARAMSDGFEPDVVVGNSLVSMYGKCGCLGDAQRTFDRMPERNLITWNAMISASGQHGNRGLAIRLLQRMQAEGVAPNEVTYVGVLSAYASEEALAEANEIHALVASTAFAADLMVANSIVNMYGKCGSVEGARRVFDSMPERDHVSWNTIITVYAQNGNGKGAFKLFQRMRSEGVLPDITTFVCIVDACANEAALAEGRQMHACIADAGCESNVVVGTALLNMYGNCGDLESAWSAFERITERDVIAWNAMIAAYAQHGQVEEIRQAYQQMRFDGVKPDGATFVSVLSAGSHLGLADECCHCFVSMFRDFGIVPKVEHYNCMLDLFGRAGRLDEMESLISSMPPRPFAASWMTLLGACRMHSDVERGRRAAERVFEMERDNPGAYVLLSNMCAAAARWEDMLLVRRMME